MKYEEWSKYERRRIANKKEKTRLISTFTSNFQKEATHPKKILIVATKINTQLNL